MCLNEKKICLDGVWTLYYEQNCNCEATAFEITTVLQLKEHNFKHINAQVPGNFELDMQREGLLPDLFFGKNSLKARELENLHLWYTTTFINSKISENMYFDFEGIDTFSKVYLNGKLIGETDNMLISHEIKAENLIFGENELVIHIIPVFLKSRQSTMGAGVLFHQPYNADAVNIRKAPHMFGWDIMPRILSGGIWRSVYLLEKPKDCIEDIYISAIKAEKERGTFHFYYKTFISNDFTTDYRLVISGECKDSRFETERQLWHTEGRTFIHIDNPYLWWPKGMGEPNLYHITIKLYRGDELLDTKELFSGLRVTRLEKSDTADEDGGEFCFYVNGHKMFVRGTNWVPLDAFHSRDKQRLPKALELLDNTNCNMVRCWGGNVYEDHEFFDFCDKHGIAVWQDFAMACSYYPQTAEFADKLRIEAEHIVKKLRNHTSLFLWVGDNECDLVITGWHPFRQNPNDNILTRKVLPEVIRYFDPFSIYIPSSPYISQKAFLEKKDKQIPEMHLWGPRKYYKADYYSKAVCHFASETGYHGCPSLNSLQKFLNTDKIWPWQDNDEWLVHATCMEAKKGAMYSTRIPLMANQMTELFGIEPDNIQDFSTSSQITQAEADKYFIERFRLGKWDKTTGILWWNLIDGWPQFSDAVVDYYYEPKVAYSVITRSQQTVCLMFREPENGELTLAVSNDSLENVTFIYKVTDIISEEVILEGNGVATSNATVDIAKTPYNEFETKFYLIEWQIGDKCYENHYLSGEVPLSYDICLKGYKKLGLIK